VKARRLPTWILTPVQWIGSLAAKARRRAKSWAAGRQQLADDTTGVITETQEFIRKASPIVAATEEVPGAITARLDALDREWSRLRPRLVKQTNRHPSDKVQQFGVELAEDVELLLQGLRYMGGSHSLEVAARAAVSESVFDRHEHAKGLAGDLLQAARAH
jgi:hypothetical protein